VPGSGSNDGAADVSALSSDAGAAGEGDDFAFLATLRGFATGLAVVTVTAGSWTVSVPAPALDCAVVADCAATGAALIISAAAATLYATHTLTLRPLGTLYGCYNIRILTFVKVDVRRASARSSRCGP